MEPIITIEPYTFPLTLILVITGICVGVALTVYYFTYHDDDLSNDVPALPMRQRVRRIGAAIGLGTVVGLFFGLVLALMQGGLSALSDKNSAISECLARAFIGCTKPVLQEDAVAANIEATYALTSVTLDQDHLSIDEITTELSPESPTYTGLHEGTVVEWDAEDEQPPLPLNAIAAEALMNADGDITVVTTIDKGDFLDASAQGHMPKTDTDEHDLVHAKAFSFGQPHGSELEVIATQGDLFVVSYTTNIEEVL